MCLQSLGWEDPLEEGMATHSSILAWRIPWTEEPGGLQSIGSHTVGYDCRDSVHTPKQSFIRRILCMYRLPVRALPSHSLDSVFHISEVFNFKQVQLINYFFHGSCLWYYISMVFSRLA